MCGIQYELCTTCKYNFKQSNRCNYSALTGLWLSVRPKDVLRKTGTCAKYAVIEKNRTVKHD